MMKRNVLLSVALLFLVGAVSSAQCVCEPVVAEKYYTIGDRVRIGDAIIEIHSIRYAKPMFGNMVVAVDVSIQNIGKDIFKVNDQWDIELVDQDGYNLRTAIFTEGRGDGLTIDLRPGRTIRGEVAFRPEQTSQTYLFSYLYRQSENLFGTADAVTLYLGSPDMSQEERQAFVDEHNARFGH